jgi:NhaA family Na+:H+ antiporter
MRGLTDPNSVGIMLGLVLGKPIGVSIVAFVAVSAGLCRLPAEVSWRHIVGAGMLGGIGFTMSIFITNLAFAAEPAIANGSKLAILVASLLSGVLGFVWLRYAGDAADGHAPRAS